MEFGYCRVSTDKQNIDKYTAELEVKGVDRIFQEKVSGQKKRPQLELLIDIVRPGDIVYSNSMSRLSRSMNDLFSIIEKFKMKKVTVVLLKENLTISPDAQNAVSNVVFNVMAALYEFEVEMQRERTKMGIEYARKSGKSLGRPNKQDEIKKTISLVENGISISEACNLTGISRSTFYKYK